MFHDDRGRPALLVGFAATGDVFPVFFAKKWFFCFHQPDVSKNRISTQNTSAEFCTME